MWYNHSLFLFYCIFTFIFKERIFKAVKKKKRLYLLGANYVTGTARPYLHEALYSLQGHNYFAYSTHEETQEMHRYLPKVTQPMSKNRLVFELTSACLSSHLPKYKIQSLSMTSHDLQLFRLKQSVLYFSICEKVFQGF